MKKKKIEEILLPYQQGVPIHPSVVVGDKIIHAVKLMVECNVNCIAVVKNNRPVGMLRLQDAFQKLGLSGSLKQKLG